MKVGYSPYMVSSPNEVPAMSSFISSDRPLVDSDLIEFSPTKTTLLDVSIKLASTNFLLWKVQVVPVLHGHAFLGYVK